MWISSYLRAHQGAPGRETKSTPVPGLVEGVAASLVPSAMAATLSSPPTTPERVGTMTTSLGNTNDSLEEHDVCWICLDGSSGEAGKESLMRPCLCPRRVHAKCIARWQLRQAGRPEEKHCRWDGNGRLAMRLNPARSAECARILIWALCFTYNSLPHSVGLADDRWMAARPAHSRLSGRDSTFLNCMLCPARRFCKSTLADWQASLTPEVLKPEMEKVQPIMVVYCEGEIKR